ncbi:hypothetical protein Trydic_g17773 [Trypoxylus dichotomus]
MVINTWIYTSTVASNPVLNPKTGIMLTRLVTIKAPSDGEDLEELRNKLGSDFFKKIWGATKYRIVTITCEVNQQKKEEV